MLGDTELTEQLGKEQGLAVGTKRKVRAWSQRHGDARERRRAWYWDALGLPERCLVWAAGCSQPM